MKSLPILRIAQVAREQTFVDDIRLFCRNPLCPDRIKDDILNYIRKLALRT